MGPNAVTDPNALLSALQTLQPPSNSSTPLERANPDDQVLEQIKAASVSLERATQFTNDPQMLLVLNAMSGTLKKALFEFDGATVMAALQQQVQSWPPSMLPQEQMAPPPTIGASPTLPGPAPAPSGGNGIAPGDHTLVRANAANLLTAGGGFSGQTSSSAF